MSGEEPTGLDDFTTIFFNTTNGTGFLPQQGRSTLRQVLSVLLTVLLAVMMIGMGCAVDLKVILKHLKKPTGILVGFVCQFGLMPACAALLAKIFNMPDVETLALLITGSCPGGSTSNVATYWVDGDMSLSITMTTISSILGLGMMPLLLFIYQETYDFTLRVPFQPIGIALAALVLPIALGVFIKYKWPQHAEKVLKVCSIGGVIAVIVVAVISIVTYGNAFSVIPSQIACAALLPGLGMILGYVISSLISLINPLFLCHHQRRTISFEAGIQNSQLTAAVIQLSSFSLSDTGRMIIFPVIYLISQVVWVLLLIGLYRAYRRFYRPKAVNPLESNEAAGTDAIIEKQARFSTTYDNVVQLSEENMNGVDGKVPKAELNGNSSTKL